MAMSTKTKSDPNQNGGGVSIDCNFVDVLNDAILEAKHVCDANLGTAPDVYVVFHDQDDGDDDEETCCNAKSTSNSNNKHKRVSVRHGLIDDKYLPITLIKPWVHHVLVEVLKNAMSSNVERFLENNISPASTATTSITNATSVHLPPSIYIELKYCQDRLKCDIMDQGIGLTSLDQQEDFSSDHDRQKNNTAEESIEKVFQFGFSSAQERWDRIEEQQSYAMVRSPLGSLGVGLTLSRMMMQMFGGSLVLANRSNGFILGIHDKKEISLDSGCTATVELHRNPHIVEWNYES
jgi:pyruvate dehydrogenase kinase 2/3/4